MAAAINVIVISSDDEIIGIPRSKTPMRKVGSAKRQKVEEATNAAQVDKTVRRSRRKSKMVEAQAPADVSTGNQTNLKPKGRPRKSKKNVLALATGERAVTDTIGLDSAKVDFSTKAKTKKVVNHEPKNQSVVDRAKLDNADVASTSKELTSPTVGETTLDCALECECCFCPYDFEYMVQCLSGHLFCCHCLERYAKESVYGQGKVDLVCMTSNCGATFLRSQIEHALPDDLIAKFDERVQEEAINMAGLTDFYKCKECHTGATLDPEVKYFHCPNTVCQKVFCKLCEVDYKDHLQLACNEIEKEEETDIRKKFEEKMSEAKIRTCHACKSKYTKEPNTCNKITCRCQRTMCYICRTPDIDYHHFCQDLRDPGLPCRKCNKCFLWSQADEDDELAINEIKNEALKTRTDKGFNESKSIGAPKDRMNEHLLQLPAINFALPQVQEVGNWIFPQQHHGIGAPNPAHLQAGVLYPAPFAFNAPNPPHYPGVGHNFPFI